MTIKITSIAVFIRRYGLSAVSLNMLLSAVAIEVCLYFYKSPSSCPYLIACMHYMYHNACCCNVARSWWELSIIQNQYYFGNSVMSLWLQLASLLLFILIAISFVRRQSQVTIISIPHKVILLQCRSFCISLCILPFTMFPYLWLQFTKLASQVFTLVYGFFHLHSTDGGYGLQLYGLCLSCGWHKLHWCS